MDVGRKTAKTAKTARQGRPRQTQKCTDVHSATQFRAQTLREISRNLTRIHDPLLTEYQVRDINDTLNRLLRERWAWEHRIKQLGGPDYTNVNTAETRTKTKNGSADTVTVKGYKYFGRAQELPEVAKLRQEAELERSCKRSGQDKAKSLQQFLQPKHWPKEDYYFRGRRAAEITAKIDSGELVTPTAEHSEPTPGLTSLTFSSSRPITEDTAFMEKFLLQQKKKWLLQRIRSK